VVVTAFKIELEGGGGELHVTMPYAMIEPIRDQLDSGVQGDRMDRDDGWTQSLREEIEEAEVDVVPVLRGSYGASRGQQAVKLTQRISRHKPPVLSNVVIGGKP
jgi:flagellar motor switch protein FliM